MRTPHDPAALVAQQPVAVVERDQLAPASTALPASQRVEVGAEVGAAVVGRLAPAGLRKSTVSAWCSVSTMVERRVTQRWTGASSHHAGRTRRARGRRPRRRTCSWSRGTGRARAAAPSARPGPGPARPPPRPGRRRPRPTSQSDPSVTSLRRCATPPGPIGDRLGAWHVDAEPSASPQQRPRVGDEAEVGHGHHRAARVGVDADDVARAAPRPPVCCTGPGDAEGDVEVGVDGHPGRADLALVAAAHPASVTTRVAPSDAPRPRPRAAAAPSRRPPRTGRRREAPGPRRRRRPGRPRPGPWSRGRARAPRPRSDDRRRPRPRDGSASTSLRPGHGRPAGTPRTPGSRVATPGPSHGDGPARALARRSRQSTRSPPGLHPRRRRRAAGGRARRPGAGRGHARPGLAGSTTTAGRPTSTGRQRRASPRRAQPARVSAPRTWLAVVSAAAARRRRSPTTSTRPPASATASSAPTRQPAADRTDDDGEGRVGAEDRCYSWRFASQRHRHPVALDDGGVGAAGGQAVADPVDRQIRRRSSSSRHRASAGCWWTAHDDPVAPARRVARRSGGAAGRVSVDPVRRRAWRP